jgi:hypothetical protein
MRQFLPLSLLCFITIFFNQTLLAQSLIRGRVLNASSKAPIDGATVVDKNTKAATSTNAAGEFSLNGKENDELQVSFVGFESKTIKLKGGAVEVQLAQASNTLNEVVVTATGIRKEVKRLGYATQTIDASALHRHVNPTH